MRTALYWSHSAPIFGAAAVQVLETSWEQRVEQMIYFPAGNFPPLPYVFVIKPTKSSNLEPWVDSLSFPSSCLSMYIIFRHNHPPIRLCHSYILINTEQQTCKLWVDLIWNMLMYLAPESGPLIIFPLCIWYLLFTFCCPARSTGAKNWTLLLWIYMSILHSVHNVLNLSFTFW